MTRHRPRLLGHRSPMLPHDGATTERADRVTSDSESDYGSDPFEGLGREQINEVERKAFATTGSQSDYGPDPFEGLGREQVDEVEREAVLRLKIETLQDEIFHTLLPKNGFAMSPKSEFLASASDRFQAAAEILHVRASKFEHQTHSAIRTMPPGLERMKSIQKLSAVLGNFQVETQDDIARIADECVRNGKSKFDERVEAQKFLSIARDHLDWDRQLGHEDFSKSEEIRPLARTAEKELLEELAREIRERNAIDDQLSQDSIGTIVNRVEQCCTVLRHVLELEKNQVLELRQFAYQLRRITEQLDSAKSLTEKHVTDRGGKHLDGPTPKRGLLRRANSRDRGRA